MGKVLIATFDDEDEMALDELLLFLKSKKQTKRTATIHIQKVTSLGL